MKTYKINFTFTYPNGETGTDDVTVNNRKAVRETIEHIRQWMEARNRVLVTTETEVVEC